VGVLGLHGKVLIAGGSCQKLPLCLTEPMPVVSKTDLPLAKAKPKPISNGGRASEVT